MQTYVAKVLKTGSLPTPMPDRGLTALATDEYGRLFTVGQSDTASLTNGSQKTMLIDVSGSVVNSYTPVTGTVALLTTDPLQPSAEDNLNAVLHVSRRPLANATNAASRYQTSALATNGIIKAATGKLFKISGFIQPSDVLGSIQYLQLYNATTVPADTAVPVFSMPYICATNTLPVSFEYEFCNYGSYYDTGFCWALSTTAATKTLTTGSNAWVQASYV